MSKLNKPQPTPIEIGQQIGLVHTLSGAVTKGTVVDIVHGAYLIKCPMKEGGGKIFPFNMEGNCMSTEEVFWKISPKELSQVV